MFIITNIRALARVTDLSQDGSVREHEQAGYIQGRVATQCAARVPRYWFVLPPKALSGCLTATPDHAATLRAVLSFLDNSPHTTVLSAGKFRTMNTTLSFCVISGSLLTRRVVFCLLLTR